MRESMKWKGVIKMGSQPGTEAKAIPPCLAQAEALADGVAAINEALTALERTLGPVMLREPESVDEGEIVPPGEPRSDLMSCLRSIDRDLVATRERIFKNVRQLDI